MIYRHMFKVTWSRHRGTWWLRVYKQETSGVFPDGLPNW